MDLLNEIDELKDALVGRDIENDRLQVKLNGVTTAEQRARDLLERMGVANAQEFSAGELVELANIINRAGPEPTAGAENFGDVCVRAGLAVKLGNGKGAVFTFKVATPDALLTFFDLMRERYGI